MKPHQRRARRRGASLGERFGRFRATTEAHQAETDRRLAALEAQQAALATEIREGFAGIRQGMADLARGQEVFGAAADALFKYFSDPAEPREAGRPRVAAAARAVLENKKGEGT